MRPIVGIGFVLLAIVVNGADAECDASGKNCVVNDYEQDGAWTRTEFTVTPVTTGESFTSTVRNDHGRINQSWGNSSGNVCREELSCGGERLVCESSAPCSSGRRGGNVWCGEYESPWVFGDDYLSATLYTCRGTDDDWPPNDPVDPTPPPHDDGNDGDGDDEGDENGKGDEGDDGDEGGGKGGGGSGKSCKIEETVKINSEYRDFLLELYARTVKRPPDHRLGPGAYASDFTVRHQAPDRTEMQGQAHGPNDRPQHAILIGQNMYMQMGGAWIQMPPRGAFPGMDEINHDQYGPRGMVPHLKGPGVRAGGDAACPRGGNCFTFHYRDDGYDNTAYFSTGDCLFRASIGQDENGPHSIFVAYKKQNVNAPDGAKSLMENPLALMELLTSGGDLFADKQDRDGDNNKEVESEIPEEEIAHHLLTINDEAYSMEIDWFAQVGSSIWFMLKDAGSAPYSRFNSNSGDQGGALVSDVDIVHESIGMAADSAATSTQTRAGENGAQDGRLGTPNNMFSYFMTTDGNSVADLAFNGEVSRLRTTDDRLILQVDDTLSRGQRQRVAISRALVADPQLLLLDEPTSGLSSSDLASVRGLIDALDPHGVIVVSTHHMSEAEGARVLDLVHGQITQIGAPASQVVGVQVPGTNGRGAKQVRIQRFGVRDLP